MELSKQMRMFAKKIMLVDPTVYVVSANEAMEWADEVAQLEAENEALRDMLRTIKAYSGTNSYWYLRIDALLTEEPFTGGTVSAYFDTSRPEEK